MDISGYWKEFQEIQDDFLLNKFSEEKKRDALNAATDLINRVEQEISVLTSNSNQLQNWAATFYRFCGELNLGLENPTAAAVGFRRSLNLRSDLETRVCLVRTLFSLGRVTDAGTELNMLCEMPASFFSTRDYQSAERILKLLCSSPELVQLTDAKVLRDVLQAVSLRECNEKMGAR